MKKSIVKTLSAFLALVLLLSVLPAAVFAAEAETNAHVHNFSTTVTNEYFVYLNSVNHARRTFYSNTCACGYSYPSHHDSDMGPHIKTGEGTYVSSYLDSNGNVRDLYSYLCGVCNHRFDVSQ